MIYNYEHCPAYCELREASYSLVNCMVTNNYSCIYTQKALPDKQYELLSVSVLLVLLPLRYHNACNMVIM